MLSARSPRSWLCALVLAACSRPDLGTASAPSPANATKTATAESATPCAQRHARLLAALASTQRRAPDALLGVDAAGCPTELLSAGPNQLGPARPFRMASVAKTFVAALALRAVSRGDLSLDGPLDRFAGALPAVRGTTLRALLQHTSGLSPYERAPSFRAWQAAKAAPLAPEDLVAFALAHTPRAGHAAFRYANTNYVLVARLLELATRLPLATLVARELTEPVGLLDTAAERGDERLVPSFDAHLRERTRAHHPSWLFGAGDLVTTLADLVRWTRFYGSGAAIPGTLRAEWLTTVATDEPGVRYGLGFFTSEGDASGGVGRARSHAGDVAGLHLEAVYFVDLDAAIVAVVNQDGGDPEALAVAAAKALRGP